MIDFDVPIISVFCHAERSRSVYNICKDKFICFLYLQNISITLYKKRTSIDALSFLTIFGIITRFLFFPGELCTFYPRLLRQML